MSSAAVVIGALRVNEQHFSLNNQGPDVLVKDMKVLLLFHNHIVHYFEKKKKMVLLLSYLLVNTTLLLAPSVVKAVMNHCIVFRCILFCIFVCTVCCLYASSECCCI